MQEQIKSKNNNVVVCSSADEIYKALASNPEESVLYLTKRQRKDIARRVSREFANEVRSEIMNSFRQDQYNGVVNSPLSTLTDNDVTDIIDYMHKNSTDLFTVRDRFSSDVKRTVRTIVDAAVIRQIEEYIENFFSNNAERLKYYASIAVKEKFKEMAEYFVRQAETATKTGGEGSNG